MNTAELLNFDEAVEEGMRDEDIQKLRNTLSDIHLGIENILYNANLVMGENISPEKLVKVNNIVQELQKATINLGSAVTEEDR